MEGMTSLLVRIHAQKVTSWKKYAKSQLCKSLIPGSSRQGPSLLTTHLSLILWPKAVVLNISDTATL